MCAIALTAPLPAAAQQEQLYVVEGPGRMACSDFSGLDPAGDQARGVAAWLTGYMTAHQRLMSDVFDLTPWQTVPVLLSLLRQYCDANGEAKVEEGAQQLVAYLRPGALTEPAKVVAVGSGKNVVLLYAPVVAEVRKKLSEAGHRAGPSMEELADALRAYQAENDLPQTGLPDQSTLVTLLR